MISLTQVVTVVSFTFCPRRPRSRSSTLLSEFRQPRHRSILHVEELERSQQRRHTHQPEYPLFFDPGGTGGNNQIRPGPICIHVVQALELAAPLTDAELLASLCRRRRKKKKQKEKIDQSCGTGQSSLEWPVESRPRMGIERRHGKM